MTNRFRVFRQGHTPLSYMLVVPPIWRMGLDEIICGLTESELNILDETLLLALDEGISSILKVRAMAVPCAARFGETDRGRAAESHMPTFSAEPKPPDPSPSSGVVNGEIEAASIAVKAGLGSGDELRGEKLFGAGQDAALK